MSRLSSQPSNCHSWLALFHSPPSQKKQVFWWQDLHADPEYKPASCFLFTFKFVSMGLLDKDLTLKFTSGGLGRIHALLQCGDKVVLVFQAKAFSFLFFFLFPSPPTRTILHVLGNASEMSFR